MSNNVKIDESGDDRVLSVRREVGGLSNQDIVRITIATALDTSTEDGDLIVGTLDKYEREIVRQREVIARLQKKVRNYRSGIKGLQRAHEASLHREKASQETAEQYRAIAQEMCSHGGCQIYVDQESDAPYSPVRFNNDILDLPVERQAELAKSV